MRWKWVLGIAALLMVTLVVTAYLILITYDYNKLKPEIIRAVNAATGRELTLGGDIELDIGFSPSLVVADVMFANTPWASQPQMIKAEEIQVRVELLPLLFGDVEFDRIGLTGVEVLLETEATGKGNWEFKTTEKSTKSFWTLKKLQVENVKIVKLNFTFHDGKSGSTSRFVLDSLEASRKPSSDELTIDLKGTANGQALALSGKTGLIRNLLAHKPFEVDLLAQISGSRITVAGVIGDVLKLDGIDLKVHALGTDLAGLGRAAGAELPETDAFKMGGEVKGSAEALALQEVKGNMSRGSIECTINGNVSDLISLTGVDLEVKGSGKDLAEIGPIVDTKLPKTGPFTVKGRLTGSGKTLTLREAQASVSSGSLRAALNGRIGDLVALKGIDFRFNGSGKDLAEIGPVIDEKLPKTGPFTVKGRLIGSGKTLTLREAQAIVSSGSLRAALNGRIGDLISLKGIDFRFNGSGKDLAEVSPIVDTKLPKTGPFTVKGRLTGSTKMLSLRDAEGSVSQTTLKLAINGNVKDLLTLSGIVLEVKGSGKELAEIGPLIETKLPEFGSFDVSGNLSGSSKALALDGLSVSVGKSDFNGAAKVEFRQRPKITLVLESGLVDFTPLIGEEKKEEKKVSEKGEYDKRLFPDDPLPFKVLKKVDADIVLKAKSMKARKAQFELGHLTLTLTDSELSIDTLEAVYKGVKISGNIHINPGSPPEVATKFLVQNFDLGSFLREILADDKVEAHIDIAADLKGRGDSAHTLAADLDGTIGFVMGQGYLSKYLDMIAMDLSQKVIPFWGSQKNQGQVNCAVVQFDTKKGLATSQAFVFDTAIQILTGEGDINLDTEKVNFLLIPKPKKRGLLNIATKLRISGTIQHPKVRPDMASLARKGIRSPGTLALGALKLLAPFVKLGAHQKHPCDIESIGKGDQSVPVKKGAAKR